jgi:superfamily II DNA/RNA helicase
MSTDLKELLILPDRPLAEEIQREMEEAGIYSLLQSDNPAASVMSIYGGPSVSESITILVHKDIYDKAVGFIQSSAYWELLSNE